HPMGRLVCPIADSGTLKFAPTARAVAARWLRGHRRRRLGSRYRSGPLREWLKFKNPPAPLYVARPRRTRAVPKMFEKLATAERVQVAKQKTERLVDHMLDLLALHESNAIVVYSDTLALQIPRSYAARAFHLFQECMFRSEIVRLC